METAPPRWGGIPRWGTSGRGRRPYPTMPPIIDELSEVFAVTAAISQVVVLGNLPPRVVVG
jgi:hypothetical protein